MPVTNRADHGRDPWMTVPSDIGEALRAGVPRARKRVISAIRSEVPAYNQPLKGEFGQVVRESVDGAVNRFIDMIERHETDALGPSRSLFYHLGRRTLREDLTLDVLLRAYQVGARAAWREIAETCTAAAVEPEIVYRLAESVIAYITELSAASAEGYTAESAAAANATQGARQELVELLVLRPPDELGHLNGAVERARYDLPARLAALACAGGEPSELAARIGPGLIGARLAGFVCVLVPEGRDDGLAEALDGADAALGPAVPPEHLPHSWEWARRTLKLMQSGVIKQHGIVPVEHYLATIFLRGDESLSGELAARWLAPLGRLGGRVSRDLPETLLAWLAHNCNFTSAAAELNLHPHTVRYRLRVLRQLYGSVLEDPDARFELELALRTTGLRVKSSSVAMPASRNGSGR